MPHSARRAHGDISHERDQHGHTAVSRTSGYRGVARGALPNGTADYRVIKSVSVTETSPSQPIRLRFQLSQPVSDIEFRDWVTNRTDTLQLYNVTVKRSR